MTHTEAADLILRSLNTDMIKCRTDILNAIAFVMDAARADERVLREALREMVYETTHLSAMDPTGTHDCTISGDTLAKARRALAQSHREPKP